MILRQSGKALSHLVESADDDRRDFPSLVGKKHPAAGALEQAQPQPVLQQLDLIADRRLGHAQFLRGGCKVFEPGSGFEHPNGGKRRQGGHGFP